MKAIKNRNMITFEDDGGNRVSVPYEKLSAEVINEGSWFRINMQFTAVFQTHEYVPPLLEDLYRIAEHSLLQFNSANIPEDQRAILLPEKYKKVWKQKDIYGVEISWISQPTVD